MSKITADASWSIPITEPGNRQYQTKGPTRRTGESPRRVEGDPTAGYNLDLGPTEAARVRLNTDKRGVSWAFLVRCRPKVAKDGAPKSRYPAQANRSRGFRGTMQLCVPSWHHPVHPARHRHWSRGSFFT